MVIEMIFYLPNNKANPFFVYFIIMLGDNDFIISLYFVFCFFFHPLRLWPVPPK